MPRFSESRVHETATIWILPGLNNSGPTHWQTLWERSDPAFRRLEQRDWDRPDCAEWVEALERAVAASSRDTVLVAHSLGCLAVVHWAARSPRGIRGALLVAPPDPDEITFTPDARGFDALPRSPLPFPSIVVASSDDPFGSLEFARRCAACWGSRLVEIGARGHINAESGLGAWQQGRELLDRLVRGEA